MQKVTLRFVIPAAFQVALAALDYEREARKYYSERGSKKMLNLSGFKVGVYADGADLSKMKQYAQDALVSGFTTNPTLIRKSGITNYREFAQQALALLPKEKPISFEVIADDAAEAYRQAREIHSWGEQVYVKIPVVNSQGVFNGALIERLTKEGVKVNVTAVFTSSQISLVIQRLLGVTTPSIISVFAGRIADAGMDPVPVMQNAARHVRALLPKGELLWASPRQVYDIFNAEVTGCHIITMTPDLIAKLVLIGKPLAQYCVETVQMFRDDALAAGLQI